MRRSIKGRALVVGVVVLSAIASLPIATTSEAGAAEPPEVRGYVLLSDDGGATCELATVDWATGAVTDLPAAASADACATDLAVAPDGTVHGIASRANIVTAIEPAAVGPAVGELLTYGEDGAPTRSDIALAADYSFSPWVSTLLAGLAIGADGTVYMLVNGLDAVTADCSVMTNDSVPQAATPANGVIYWWGVPCLFELDTSTGLLTLVGSTGYEDGVTLLLTIGSDTMRTMSGTYEFGDQAVPSEMRPSVALPLYWSTVAATNGSLVESDTIVRDATSGFDALRSGTTVYTIDVSDPDAPATGTVDPATGVVTRLAALSDANVVTGVLGVIEVVETEPTTTTTTTTTEDAVAPKHTG